MCGIRLRPSCLPTSLGSGLRTSGWVERTSGSGGGSSLPLAVSAAHHKSRPPHPPRFGKEKVTTANSAGISSGSEPLLHLKYLHRVCTYTGTSISIGLECLVSVLHQNHYNPASLELDYLVIVVEVPLTNSRSVPTPQYRLADTVILIPVSVSSLARLRVYDIATFLLKT